MLSISVWEAPDLFTARGSSVFGMGGLHRQRRWACYPIQRTKVRHRKRRVAVAIQSILGIEQLIRLIKVAALAERSMS